MVLTALRAFSSGVQLSWHSSKNYHTSSGAPTLFESFAEKVHKSKRGGEWTDRTRVQPSAPPWLNWTPTTLGARKGARTSFPGGLVGRLAARVPQGAAASAGYGPKCCRKVT